MIDQVLRAADGRSLNTLSLHLDQQGETGRDELTALLFSGSKDPDGTCRSFLSRLKAADETERRGEEQAAAVFRSLTVARIKAKGGAAALLRPSTQGAAAGDRPDEP